MPELNERQLYENFAGELWRAYKEMAQRSAEKLDSTIGFIFSDDKGIRKGNSGVEAEKSADRAVDGAVPARPAEKLAERFGSVP